MRCPRQAGSRGHRTDGSRRRYLRTMPSSHHRRAQPLVVLPRVDIERNAAGHGNFPHREATRFDELPDTLVTMQSGQLTEYVAAQPEWMPDPVRVPAHSDQA